MSRNVETPAYAHCSTVLSLDSCENWEVTSKPNSLFLADSCCEISEQSRRLQTFLSCRYRGPWSDLRFLWAGSRLFSSWRFCFRIFLLALDKGNQCVQQALPVVAYDSASLPYVSGRVRILLWRDTFISVVCRYRIHPSLCLVMCLPDCDILWLWSLGQCTSGMTVRHLKLPPWSINHFKGLSSEDRLPAQITSFKILKIRQYAPCAPWVAGGEVTTSVSTYHAALAFSFSSFWSF